METIRAFRSAALILATNFLLLGQTPSPKVLTTVQQVRSLSEAEASLHRRLLIRGVVTTVSGWANSFFLQDSTGGIAVDRDEPNEDVKSGDLVEIEGVSNPGSFAPSIQASRVRVVGSAALPVSRVFSLEELVGGAEDSQWIELRGVVRSAYVGRFWGHTALALTIASGNGQFTASSAAV